MVITVFGPGCARCRETESLVRDVVQELGLAIEVIKVSDFKAMMACGVMSTPALALDGKVLCTGRVPDKAEVVRWLRNAGECQAESAGASSSACGCRS